MAWRSIVPSLWSKAIGLVRSLFLPCLILAFIVCVPFLWARTKFLTTDPYAVLLATSGLVLLLGVRIVSLARRIVQSATDPTRPETGPHRCAVCGSDAGEVLCLGCGSLQPHASGYRPMHAAASLSLAALVIHRWPTLFAILATVYVPGAYTVFQQADRAAAERLQRRNETARAFATAWSEIRGPLIAFGTECGPIAARGERLPEHCSDLISQLSTSYVRMSWHVPRTFGELRTTDCSKPTLRERRTRDLSAAACDKLRSPIPLERSSDAFIGFLNAHASYQHAATPANVARLATSARNFYWRTRELGCVLMFANMADIEADAREGLSLFCSYYLLGAKKNDEQRSVHWCTWFGPDWEDPPANGEGCAPPKR